MKPRNRALRVLGILLYVTVFVAFIAATIGAPLLAWHLTESIVWTIASGVGMFILFATSLIVFLDSATW